jgi:transposase-like protein
MRTPKDWGQPCPNPACTHYRRMQQGNVSALATYLTHSGQRRIFRCRTCATHFSETRETVFFDLHTSEEKVMMARKMLLVRVDLAGICFVLGVTEETVLGWLRRAAQQAEAINHHLLRHLPVTQVQLDEMWNFIERKHACETAAAGESLPDGEDGRQWVWISLAPEFRLMIAAIVGPRTLETAKEVVATTKARVAGIPAFFSDGFTCSLAALIAAFHVVTTCTRTGKRGRPRKPLCEPHPALVYGQLVKQKQQGKLRTLSTRVVLGAERLTHLGFTISTALSNG